VGAPAQDGTLPGSCGEHELQERFGTARRARSFYDRQVVERLTDEMCAFVGRQELMFVSTADGAGACDATFRAGPPGFVHVVDDRTLAYPEYRGNGVMASLGNISENPHIGMLFVDFFTDVIGLHVNGRARIVEDDDLPDVVELTPAIAEARVAGNGRRPERWVVVAVEEAYVHCSKHIPWLAKRDKATPWGTDDVRAKGGDHFGAARRRAR
jgi:predicted pyridoxine 5'-phosphate oxidase superfamily flavin-nucleotide-binding protein